MRSNISDFTGPSKANQPKIELVAVTHLKPSKNNARTHSKKQIGALAASLKQFGFNTVVAVDDEGAHRGGPCSRRGREACRYHPRPCRSAHPHLSNNEIRAFMLADNKLAERAGWDRELLAAEFLELQIALPTLNLDLSITGFTHTRFDLVLGDFNQGNNIGPGSNSATPSKCRVTDRRSVPTRPSSASGWRRSELGRLSALDAVRKRDDGIFGPALQCPDRRPCWWSWPRQASRIRLRIWRDDIDTIYQLSPQNAFTLRKTYDRWRHYVRMHGLAPRPRAIDCRRPSLF